MMSPGGAKHGSIISKINARLERFVEENSLGWVMGAETGFQIGHNPDTVRAPDVAFISRARCLSGLPEAFFQGAPDLAVEVLSPGDRASKVLAKVQVWLSAGCSQVWLVDPATRTVTVHRRADQIERFGAGDELPGGDLLPGFRLAVAEIFG